MTDCPFLLVWPLRSCRSLSIPPLGFSGIGLQLYAYGKIKDAEEIAELKKWMFLEVSNV